MRPTLLVLLLCLFTWELSAQVTGTWYGVLEAGGQRLPLNVEITESAGELEGGLQSPAQHPARIPMTTVVSKGDSLRFAIAAASLRFAGTVAGDSLVGTFHQGGFSTPLRLYRTKPSGYDELVRPAEKAARPQEPTDFPYKREDVRFPGGADSVTLAGELTLPTNGDARAALVLVSGSGPQDRNEDLGPAIDHRPFLVLSDRLTRAGYAVLRYDDRGVGESTGDHASATSADLAEDAAAAVVFLRKRLGNEAPPVGIAGHSEGGMIGPLVAAREPGVDFLVLLAAPGLPIDELMAEQRRLTTGATPQDEPVLAAVTAYVRAHPEQDDTTFRAGLRDTILTVIPTLPTSVRESIEDDATFADTYVSGLSGPWVRYFLAYDPAPTLARVTVPVLAINGEKDTQVSPRNLDAVGEALEGAGNQDVTLRLMPGLNHLLQPAETGLPAEYGEITTTLDESVLQLVVDWLNQRFE